MDEKTAQLLELWNEREARFTEKIAQKKSRLEVALGNPLDFEKMAFEEKVKRAPIEAADLISAEAKLAELKECVSEFRAAFISPSGAGA